MRTPFADGQRQSIVIQDSGSYGKSPVICLLRTGRPAAVAKLVVAVRIRISVKACSGRPFSHVFEEVLEGLPALADADAATSISIISLIILIGASRGHRRP